MWRERYLVKIDKSVARVAFELDAGEPTIYNWRVQDLIGPGANADLVCNGKHRVDRRYALLTSIFLDTLVLAFV